jgi:hypothetical protein
VDFSFVHDFQNFLIFEQNFIFLHSKNIEILMKEYKNRIADQILTDKLEAMGAAVKISPKGNTPE